MKAKSTAILVPPGGKPTYLYLATTKPYGKRCFALKRLKTVTRSLLAYTGEMVFSSAASYRGSFGGNKFHGFGRYEWNDGATYEGGWRENKCVV